MGITTAPDGKSRYTLGEPGDFKVATGTGSFFSNASTIAAQTIAHPAATSLIFSPAESAPSKPGENVEAIPGTIIVGRNFKMIFLSVLAMTAASAVIHIIMSFVLVTPTPLQAETLSALRSGWQGGIGAIFGLLTAKAAN